MGKGMLNSRVIGCTQSVAVSRVWETRWRNAIVAGVKVCTALASDLCTRHIESVSANHMAPRER